MGEQIIQQPNGLLAVWSTVVDDWTVFDATADELVERAVTEAAKVAAEDARRRTLAIIEKVVAGDRRPYFQFTMTFDEAQALKGRRYGSAPWPPAEGDGDDVG